jgi:hypothetical protein
VLASQLFEALQTWAQIRKGTRELNEWESGPTTDIVLLLDLWDISEAAVGRVAGTLLLTVGTSYELMDHWLTSYSASRRLYSVEVTEACVKST